MMNDTFKLPFQFSEELLLKDLDACNSLNFVRHFNDFDYNGTWSAISLRSPDGRSNNIHAFATEADAYKNTELLAQCPYFKEVIDQFQCEKATIRLLNLAPNSKIKEHTDYNLGYEDGIFRIHIPIATNSMVEFRVNHRDVRMEVGECWYGNFNLPHSVSNNSKFDRVHLVIDCLRNDWSNELFKQMGYDFEAEHKTPQYSKDVKLKMIESLKSINTKGAIDLIAQLERELKADN